MSISLTSQDFARVVEILGSLPDFRTVQARADLITDVFAGTPLANRIVTTLDLDGPPRSVAVRVIQRLQAFGQDEPGRETLGVLINKVLAYLGSGTEADDLRAILTRYPFTTKPTADFLPIANWAAKESPEHIHERIIGENTLRDLFVLELALDAARAVVRISTPVSLGTGFMVAPDLLMTNHHVIPDATTAAHSVYTFNYQIDRHRVETPASSHQAAAGGSFYTNRDLDISVIQLDDTLPAFDALVLRAERAGHDQRVTIIQHPGGHYKKISMQNNFVVYSDENIIQYTTSTEPGSSGSPVFNAEFEVIGVHHAGGFLRQPGSGEQFLRNEGISVIAVVNDLGRHAPPIHERLVHR
jgi:S1-C subfamily serine protease